jgi:dTDP-4-dehydrorhamnose reductase
MIVVTGATGQLGTAFRRLLGDDARYLARADLDLSDPDAIQRLLERLRPTVLINCAAYTAVDRAESEPNVAEAINMTAVGVMAAVTANIGAKFVTFSTDYVFDGTAKRPYVESDPTRPINVYGSTKREGEIAAGTANPEALVIRTSWLLSGTHHNFATTMIRLAREGDVSVVDDQHGHPTLVNDLARASLAALNSGATGILHLTNNGATTWFGLAQEIVGFAGLAPDRIRPCATSDYPTAAKRPAHSILASERLDRLKLDPLPSYRPGLREAVSEIVDWLP